MLYVIGFFIPPVALFLAHRPLQAVVALACYILAWIGVVVGLIPGLILYFFPIFFLWFALFWFIPAAYTIAVIQAQAAGKVTPEWVDYAFALSRLSFTLLSITVFLVASYAVFWLYTAHRFQERLDTWAKTQHYPVRWVSASLEGFPLDVRLRLTSTTFSETKLFPYKFSAPLVTIDTTPWDPTLVDIRAQKVTGSEALAGLSIGDVYGQVRLPGAPSTNPQENFQGLNVNLRGLRLPEAPRPLSDTIESAQIIAQFKGNMPPGLLREALGTWRDNGGSIELLSIELHWDAFELTIYNGILKLDQTLQPTGSFTASIVNQTTAIDAVVAAGGLSAQDGDAVKSALASSAKLTTDGSPHFVADMSIENSHLKIGATEIVALPRIKWPMRQGTNPTQLH